MEEKPRNDEVLDMDEEIKKKLEEPEDGDTTEPSKDNESKIKDDEDTK